MEDSRLLLSPVEIFALRRTKSFSPLDSPPARVPLTREDSVGSPVFLKRCNDDPHRKTRPLPKRPASAPPAPEQRPGQREKEEEEEGEEAAEKQQQLRRATGWKCINASCDNADRSLLSQNDQGDHVCDMCGVCNGRTFIGLARQKNCAWEDDRTVVAEFDQDDAPRYLDGEETAAQARARHLRRLPGGGVPARRTQRRGKFEMADLTGTGEVDFNEFLLMKQQKARAQSQKPAGTNAPPQPPLSQPLPLGTGKASGRKSDGRTTPASVSSPTTRVTKRPGQHFFRRPPRA